MADPNQFLIEAVIQEFPETTYIKMSYLHGNDNVDWHMGALQGVYYRVASVKSRPALQADLEELLFDAQGNMPVIDDTILELNDVVEHNDISNLRIVSNESSNSDPRPESSSD